MTLDCFSIRCVLELGINTALALLWCYVEHVKKQLQLYLWARNLDNIIVYGKNNMRICIIC
ncbi:hypothetical protein glysoja_019191 [Glycine soja]|nr:hypothetical protein glysoja_019191 [Glycine soja]